LKGFIGPYLLAFFIVEFVLVMQYLWKVIDDILGKGYGILDYLELLFYLSVALIPLALPLTVLLSSVMVYGDMSEKYELSSLKSAGISLNRMIMPGLIIALVTCGFSILASNVLKPQANEDFIIKIRRMKTNQLTFVFDEKIFNKEFRNYSIWIDKKHSDGRTIEGIMIYDHTDADKSVMNLIVAERGEMYTVENQKFLVMDLEDGYQIKEIRAETADKSFRSFGAPARPVSRFKFKKLRKSFELARLLNMSITNIQGQQYEMMNTNELLTAIDSLHMDIEENLRANILNLNNRPKARNPVIKFKENEDPENKNVNKTNPALNQIRVSPVDTNYMIDTTRILTEENVSSLVHLIPWHTRKEIVQASIRSSKALEDRIRSKLNENKMKHFEIRKYGIRLHQQYAWAFVCIIFLFIGAPAGAIVRKGGFGFPILIATGFYMAFIILKIIGEKLMKGDTLDAPMAAWLPCIVLTPFAIFLTYKALNDRKLFESAIFTLVGDRIRTLLKLN
jgi:lipopolysaccharide export system permease protein